MPPLFGNSTSYRLARIAALVVGSLLFLYACERSRSTMLSDVWVEILLATTFGMAGIGAAWFEIMIDERSARKGQPSAPACITKPVRGSSRAASPAPAI